MPRAAEILLADDERAIRALLKKALESRGYVVRVASDGRQALALYKARRPDLLVLDVMMPGMDGREVCREVRRGDADTPILFLTALDSEADEVAGLGAGADDYVAKTVPEGVLFARVEAALRRRRDPSAAFDFGEWRVDPDAMAMSSQAGGFAALSEREVALLRAFASSPQAVFSRDALLTRFWGDDGSEAALNVAMHKLRGKLGAAGRDIRAVHGVGYAYHPPSRAIVSLGSNIEPRARHLEKALAALAKLPATRLAAASSVIETEPVDVPAEFASMKFLNQAAVFMTELGPREFSRGMHRVEDALGRVRTVRNGPRTIDIDLIDFAGMRLSDPALTLPHPRAAGRDFVTRPLAELGIELDWG